MPSRSELTIVLRICSAVVCSDSVNPADIRSSTDRTAVLAISSRRFPRAVRVVGRTFPTGACAGLITSPSRSRVCSSTFIVAAPVDGPFGRTFTFADPDGYRITLHDRA